jgi:hypothetical protein
MFRTGLDACAWACRTSQFLSSKYFLDLHMTEICYYHVVGDVVPIVVDDDVDDHDGVQGASVPKPLYHQRR